MDNTLFSSAPAPENLSPGDPDGPSGTKETVVRSKEEADASDGPGEQLNEIQDGERKNIKAREDAEGTEAKLSGSKALDSSQRGRLDRALQALEDVRKELNESSARSNKALAEVAATVAVQALRVGQDPEIMRGLVDTLNETNKALDANAPAVSFGQRARSNPTLLLARLVMPAGHDKHRRTTVVCAAQLAASHVLAEAMEGGRTQEQLVRSNSLRKEIANWICVRGGVTGLYNRHRAETRGKRNGGVVDIRLRDEPYRALESNLEKKACALILVTRDADGGIRPLVEGQESIDVVPLRTNQSFEQCKKEYGGEIRKEAGSQFLRGPATSAVLRALADGSLSLWIAPKVENVDAAKK
ncbi:hypothetical protein [Sabulicella rubraurantiaca]|uniref:hypothetical protein n=1 Tax=Sabulicella rubraurantiaca TaxID=2811429 RepID=UPI001A95B3E7|nr:hypothetical protein [Sabulicella rubraurantiaca]